MTKLLAWMKLRGIFREIAEKSRMGFKPSVVLQLILLAVQALNQLLHLVPEEYRVYVTAVVGVLQAVAGLMALFVNPDGTPAKHPWQGPKSPDEG